MDLTTDFQILALFKIGEEQGDTFSWVDSVLDWHGDEEPTLEEIQTKADELEAEEPMRLLRKYRNYLLSVTDYWGASDLTMSAEQKAYRTALRDLPASASPALSTNYSYATVTRIEKNNPERLSKRLTGVTFPTKPE